MVEVAASGKDKKKADKKRTDPAQKRAMLAVERRLYNRARKSAVATRIKKVGHLQQAAATEVLQHVQRTSVEAPQKPVCAAHQGAWGTAPLWPAPLQPTPIRLCLSVSAPVSALERVLCPCSAAYRVRRVS